MISPLPEISAASKSSAVPWAGEVGGGAGRKAALSLVQPSAPRGRQGAGPTLLPSQRGGVQGSEQATRLPVRGSAGHWAGGGGCPSGAAGQGPTAGHGCPEGGGPCGTGVWWQGGSCAAQQPMGGQLRLWQPIGAWDCLDGHGGLG